jgi:hypothetical protein
VTPPRRARVPGTSCSVVQVDRTHGAPPRRQRRRIGRSRYSASDRRPASFSRGCADTSSSSRFFRQPDDVAWAERAPNCRHGSSIWRTRWHHCLSVCAPSWPAPKESVWSNKASGNLPSPRTNGNCASYWPSCRIADRKLTYCNPSSRVQYGRCRMLFRHIDDIDAAANPRPGRPTPGRETQPRLPDGDHGCRDLRQKRQTAARSGWTTRTLVLLWRHRPVQGARRRMRRLRPARAACAVAVRRRSVRRSPPSPGSSSSGKRASAGRSGEVSPATLTPAICGPSGNSYRGTGTFWPLVVSHIVRRSQGAAGPGNAKVHLLGVGKPTSFLLGQRSGRSATADRMATYRLSPLLCRPEDRVGLVPGHRHGSGGVTSTGARSGPRSGIVREPRRGGACFRTPRRSSLPRRCCRSSVYLPCSAAVAVARTRSRTAIRAEADDVWVRGEGSRRAW